MNRFASAAQDGKRFKLMAVLAHPDDESLGFGGTLARYSAEEVETYLVTATRGERGRFFFH
jgi:LmbE family N-acetylglucosaminyl deacetylase